MTQYKTYNIINEYIENIEYYILGPKKQKKKEIEKYLSTGIIRGIGPVTAKKIVKAFGKDTLDILDNHIERLKEVEGIGEKKFNIIYESYLESKELKDIIMFFQKLIKRLN